MAIAFDAASASGAKGSGSSITWNHTTSAGSDRILLVGVSFRQGTPPTVTGVTYNGVAMTFLRADDVFRARTELWYLVNPASGTNSTVVSLSAAISEVAAAGAVSLTGADQTTPMDVAGGAGATQDSGASVTSASCGITTVTDNAWTFGAFTWQSDLSSLTVGSGETERWQTYLGSIVQGHSCGSTSSAAVSPAGSKTMDYTYSASGSNFAVSVAAIRPAGGAATSVRDMIHGYIPHSR